MIRENVLSEWPSGPWGDGESRGTPDTLSRKDFHYVQLAVFVNNRSILFSSLKDIHVQFYNLPKTQGGNPLHLCFFFTGGWEESVTLDAFKPADPRRKHRVAPAIITSSIFWTTRSKPSVDFMGHICPPVPPTHLLCVNYGSFFSPRPHQPAVLWICHRDHRRCVRESDKKNEGGTLRVPETDWL